MKTAVRPSRKDMNDKDIVVSTINPSMSHDGLGFAKDDAPDDPDELVSTR